MKSKAFLITTIALLCSLTVNIALSKKDDLLSQNNGLDCQILYTVTFNDFDHDVQLLCDNNVYNVKVTRQVQSFEDG